MTTDKSSTWKQWNILKQNMREKSMSESHQRALDKIEAQNYAIYVPRVRKPSNGFIYGVATGSRRTLYMSERAERRFGVFVERQQISKLHAREIKKYLERKSEKITGISVKTVIAKIINLNKGGKA